MIIIIIIIIIIQKKFGFVIMTITVKLIIHKIGNYIYLFLLKH
jgi:hypothetical protein